MSISHLFIHSSISFVWGSSYILSSPGISNFSQEILIPFIRNGIWRELGASCTHYYWCIVSGPSQCTALRNTCLLTHVYMHIYIYFYAYSLVLKSLRSYWYLWFPSTLAGFILTFSLVLCIAPFYENEKSGYQYP